MYSSTVQLDRVCNNFGYLHFVCKYCVKVSTPGKDLIRCMYVAGGADAPAPVRGRWRSHGAPSLVRTRKERTDCTDALGPDRRRHGAPRHYHRQVPYVNGPLNPAVTLTSPHRYRCYTAPDASLSHKAAYNFCSNLSKASIVPFLCSSKSLISKLV